jgi:hypothetical protein
MDRRIVIPSWASTGAINLGLDFGTYSTKLIMRVRGASKRPLVLFLDEPDPEYPAFAVPSLVCLSNGKLFFGQEARRRGGHLFSSLKVSLLPPPPLGTWDPDDFPHGTTPDLLVAIYLAWILGRVKMAVGEDRASRFSLNVAAPMNHVENQALKERYLQVVNAAWQAAFENAAPLVTQEAELNRLGSVFTSLLARPVPALENRRFEILPETLAPLASLFWDPKTHAGLYMMVDMGAGTTELSVSRVSEPGEDGAMVCYEDNSVLLGGNMFRENDRQNAASTENHTRVENRMKTTLRSEFRRVWYSGFLKEKDAGRTAKYQWKQLNVVLAGGGLRRQGLQETIEASSPLDTGYFIDPTGYTVNWHGPADLVFDEGEPAFVLRDPLDSPAYLAVACGLSLERQKWPKFYYPKEVPVRRREPGATNPYERTYSQSDVG